MAYQFPKRILEEGAETQIDKINNTCRRTILETVKGVLKDEYEEVLKDPVFSLILAIVENKLIYSEKIIHSFICKQLKVSKLHELWFLFAKRPLRFSMEEFHAVTGLKFKDEPEIDFINWKDDKGFWSLVLKQNRKINLFSVRDELLKECKEWTYVDRVRLVYLCIIHGFIMAKDWKVSIPQEYIRLVMDFEKLRMYPWGLRAYDELLASIFRAREDLYLKNSYVLDGFLFAFKIWIMEAVPDIGTMVCKKIKKTSPNLESHFDKGELFPFISHTGNNDVVDNAEFIREDEKKDQRVGRIVALMNAKQDWNQFAWEVEALPRNMELSDSEVDVEVEDVTEEPSVVAEEPAVVAEEPVVVAKRGKHKLIDPGVESRKKQLLCQRAAEHNSGVSGDLKTFIEGLFTSSFNSLKELVQKDIQKRFDKVHNEMAQLKETMSQVTGPSHTEGKTRASEIPALLHTEGKDQDKSSQSPGPSAGKGKAKGKAAENLPPMVRRSPLPDVQNSEDDMMDFLKNLSQSSNIKVEMETQEYLQDAMGNLSQSSYVKGFDPSQKLNGEEPAECVTPLTSFKPADWRPPTLKDTDLHEDRVNDSDYSLVFVLEDSWAKLIKWSSTSIELAARVMGPTEWLLNNEIDAMMYLFTERASLRQWEPTKVVFMTFMFSNQMKNSFEEFRKDMKEFKWDVDVTRMYVPLNVGKHWISMCANFVSRSIEVFDCEGLKHTKSVEPFAVLIPRIVKAVHSSNNSKLKVKQYTVSYVPMPLLNKSSNDCGVYYLKHIEFHLLGLDFSLVNDNNIREARQKIAYDLWEAANDPVLISRIAQFTLPKIITNPVVELE
uniref:Ubiquitin-like protease family profile domain-containing protein n=1 Tax=Brassica oleracea var. oleracea TaxID=109376 RepID=A0A0D3CG81_BRAOL